MPTAVPTVHMALYYPILTCHLHLQMIQLSSIKNISLTLNIMCIGFIVQSHNNRMLVRLVRLKAPMGRV